MSFLPVFVTCALLVASFANPAAAAVCEPDCSGHVTGDKVEDPRNCNQYYICQDANKPSQQPVACQPPTIVFDPLYGDCVEGDSCVASCTAPACQLRCEGVLDVIPDPWNCNQYYYCDAAYNPGPAQQCPSERPYFDGVTCSSDVSVCCSVSCTPNCGPGDVQIPDPTDCTMYYVCVEEGTPSEDNHHTCSPGETFQPSSSLCESNGVCLNLCYGPPSTTTTSTTTTTTETTTETTTTSTTTTSPTTTTTESTTTSTIMTTTELLYCDAFHTCSAPGYFPMCNYCQPGYFECLHEGDNGVPMLCPDGYHFNTNPDYPYCVLEEDCPYPSP